MTVIRHLKEAREVATQLIGEKRLLIAERPFAGKSIFLEEVLQALVHIGEQEFEGENPFSIHRRTLGKTTRLGQVIRSFIREYFGQDFLKTLEDPLSLPSGYPEQLDRICNQTIPVLVLDGLDEFDMSEPPPWLDLLKPHLLMLFCGRVGPQVQRLYHQGWKNCAPAPFVRREDAHRYLEERLRNESKFLTSKQTDLILDAQDGCRLGTLNRFLEVLLTFGELLPNEEIDSRMTENIKGLMAEIQLRRGWAYALLMLLNCQHQLFTTATRVVACLCVSRRGLTMEEIENVLRDEADRAGEVAVMLAGLVEWSEGRLYLRDASQIEKAITGIPLWYDGENQVCSLDPQDFWRALRRSGAKRMLDLLLLNSSFHYPDVQVDALHLISKLVDLVSDQESLVISFVEVLEQGGLASALMVGDITWLEPLLRQVGVSDIGGIILQAVRAQVPREPTLAPELQSLIRYLGRLGHHRFAIGIAVSLLEEMREVGESEWGSSRAWLLLDEMLALLPDVIGSSCSPGEFEERMAEVETALDIGQELISSLEGPHRIAYAIHLIAVDKAKMEVVERLTGLRNVEMAFSVDSKISTCESFIQVMHTSDFQEALEARLQRVRGELAS